MSDIYGIIPNNVSDINWFAADKDGDFGTADLDDYYEKEYGDKKKPKTCDSPGSHRFEKKLLATHYYRECVFCGYSPELDKSKPDHRICHEEFLIWEEARKPK